MDCIKVLQIEDSLDYQFLFRQLTKKQLNITLVATISDLKNLSLKEWQDIQIIILDGQLPDGTGMDVLNYLKINNINVPVVANSSSNKYNQAMLDLGAKWSFAKDRFPQDLKEIIANLQKLIAV